MTLTLTWSVEVLWCLRQCRYVVVSAVHRGADGALAGGSLHDAFSNVITALIHSTHRHTINLHGTVQQCCGRCAMCRSLI